jgi:glyoxylase-like metal-dependent hydrolase (beta-lactamase superfamily II)
MHIQDFFDTATNTVSYIVYDDSKQCAIIDSVLDFDYASGRTNTANADNIIQYVEMKGLTVEWILETHVHADHLSAAPYLQERLGGDIAIGAHIQTVQETFGKIFNEGTEFERDGSQFDRLFRDGDEFMIGDIRAKVMHTPGHTPACLTYLIEDAAFVGDTMFMPDFGTARCDFPGGSAEDLYDSIQKILALPDETRIFVGHDYAPNGRDFAWETTVGEQKAKNVQIADKSKDEYVAMREAKDATLSHPKLIIPSLQVNMRAGEVPETIKVPVNKL